MASTLDSEFSGARLLQGQSSRARRSSRAAVRWSSASACAGPRPPAGRRRLRTRRTFRRTDADRLVARDQRRQHGDHVSAASTSSARARGPASGRSSPRSSTSPSTAISIPQFDTGSAHPFPNTRPARRRPATGPRSAARSSARRRRRRGGTLLGLASTQLGVPVASLTVDNGVVSGGGRSATYGSSARRQAVQHDDQSRSEPGAAEADEPVQGRRDAGAALRHPRQGHGQAHLHAERARPRDVHGRPVRPRGQGDVLAVAADGRAANYRLLSVDESSIKHIAGAQVVRRGDFVGVVAPTEYAAVQGAAQLKVQWPEAARCPESGTCTRP